MDVPTVFAHEIQYANGEGPCVDTLRGDEVVPVSTLPTQTRWVGYVPPAAALGVRCHLAIRLPPHARALCVRCGLVTRQWRLCLELHRVPVASSRLRPPRVDRCGRVLGPLGRLR
jgi:hypothetical protein